ncbi:MAG: TonB-dependent receptor [Bacteroidales bacterium]|nr:TonB-dependent receptor [Bacteroidales bacterium]
MIRKVLLLLIFACAAWLTVAAQEKHTLSGYVADENGEMLIGVYIIVLNTHYGTVTNTYGFYSITLPEGAYTFRYSFIGYGTKEFGINLVSNTEQNVTLAAETSAIGQVTITAERKDENIHDVTMSNVQLPARTIRKIPNLMGETDIIKSIQLLPGVQSSVEGSSGLYVRGGNADQNLILLDGATVYNPSHLFGFFSVFNGDAVKNVELFKGGIPAEYGGRLSSVLDVRMVEGNTQKIKGSAGIGMISSRLTLEGPIVKDKISFIFTGRRTYADLFLPFAKDTVARNSTIYFYDLNAKINYQINRNNRLFLSGYFGRDVNVFDDLFQMNFGNATGTLRWNHVYNGKLFSNLTLIFSDFSYNLGVPSGILSFKILSHIIDYGFHNDYTWYINPSNTMKFGLQATCHTIKPGTIKSSDPASILSTLHYPDNRAIETAFFASNEQKIGTWLTFLYGVRFSMFQNIGAATLYHYDEYHDVVDSTLVPAGNVFNTYTSLEPRFNLRIGLSEKSSVKLSYNRTAQYLHLASNSTATFPLDMWFMSSPNLKPQKADQAALGIFRNFRENSIEASVEVFYKRISNAIDFKDHARLAPQKYLEGELRIGSAYSYGAEILLQKQGGRLSGWLSYAYIRTFRKIPEINQGKAFPPPYDKPHNISLLINYEISDRFDAGLNWVYSTAIPVTVPTSGYYYDDVWVPVYSRRGGTRIPGTAYHRMDLSLNYYFRTFKMESSLNVSVYNVYNRHNAFAVYFREQDAEGSSQNITGTEAVKLYLFPIVPAITYNIKF